MPPRTTPKAIGHESRIEPWLAFAKPLLAGATNVRKTSPRATVQRVQYKSLPAIRLSDLAKVVDSPKPSQRIFSASPGANQKRERNPALSLRYPTQSWTSRSSRGASGETRDAAFSPESVS